MFNKDAFSNGQIDSKLWLCRKLEALGWSSDYTHIYAGWYGVLAFLLLSREKFKVGRIESFDMDPTAEAVADMINENWVIKEWKFKAFTLDCNQGVILVANTLKVWTGSIIFDQELVLLFKVIICHTMIIVCILLH
jgi:hypothetical protein